MFRLFVCLMLWPMAAMALEPVARNPNGAITDHAMVILPDREADLEARIAHMRARTGVEIAVLTLESLAPYAPNAPIADFAHDTMQDWRIGGSGARHDGIFVVMATRDRVLYVALGEAYEAKWNAHIERILQNVILPDLRGGNYSYALDAGISALIHDIAEPAYYEGYPDKKPRDKTPGLIGKLLFLCAFIAIFALRFRARIQGIFLRCPQCGKRGLTVSRHVMRHATQTHAGQAQRTSRCNSCGYESARLIPLPKTGENRRNRADREDHHGRGGHNGRGAPPSETGETRDGGRGGAGGAW